MDNCISKWYKREQLINWYYENNKCFNLNYEENKNVPFENTYNGKIKEENERSFNIEIIFDLLKNEFGIQNCIIKKTIEPYSPLFNCSSNKVKEYASYYIKLLKGTDNFLKVLKECDKILFNATYKNRIDEQMIAIGKCFNCSFEEIIKIISSNEYYLRAKIDKIYSRIAKIADKQKISIDECKDLLKRYPFIITYYQDDIRMYVDKYKVHSVQQLNSNFISVKIKYVEKKEGEENTIVISKKLVESNLFISKIKHVFNANEVLHNHKNSIIKRGIAIAKSETQNLDEDGFIKEGDIVSSNDVVVEIGVPQNKSEFSQEERVLSAIFGDNIKVLKDKSIRFPYGCNGKVISVDKINNRIEILQSINVEIGDIISDKNGLTGKVIDFRDDLGKYDIIANFSIAQYVKKVHIAQLNLCVRSTGSYSLETQRPLGAGMWRKAPQNIYNEDLINIYKNGLEEVYKTMLLFQKSNPRLREKLYESIIIEDGECHSIIPDFDLNKLKCYLASICVELVFVDDTKKILNFSLSNYKDLEEKYYQGKINLLFKPLLDDQIKELSFGEIKGPETFDYLNHAPEKDGLFGENIFGPIRDFECHCGKYRGKKYYSKVCKQCGVEITSSRARYERMGHIELAVSIPHPILKDIKLKYLPVLPPELRPMIRFANGSYASTDLNDYYKRVLNRNNRLKRSIETKAPLVLILNDTRMLIDAVGELFFGGVINSGGRSLKCLIDNILDLLIYNIDREPFDYSACCNVCINDDLNNYECGLPIPIAVELFRPFIIHRLIAEKVCTKVKDAIQYIDYCIKHYCLNSQDLIIQKVLLITDIIVKNYNLMVLGEKGTKNILIVKPMLAESNVLFINKTNYNKLNIKSGNNARIFLPATKVAQELCNNIEQKNDTITMSCFEDGNLFETIKYAILLNKECDFKDIKSRLLFKILSKKTFDKFPIDNLWSDDEKLKEEIENCKKEVEKSQVEFDDLFNIDNCDDLFEDLFNDTNSNNNASP